MIPHMSNSHFFQSDFQNTQGLIYVVDSTSPESLEDARQRLYEDLNEPALAKTPLLVYANKQDLPGAISTEKIADILELEELEDRMWHIQVRTFHLGC
jgi:signal recognition particle receptor subunit beta